MSTCTGTCSGLPTCEGTSTCSSTCSLVCGSIAGHVTDSLSTAAIQGANVSASGPGSGSDTTDEFGYYEIGGLTPGTYSVTASATGYQDETHTGITVNAGWTTTVDFALTPVDTTPPTINIVKPAVDGEYVSGTAVVKAYISDASGVAWAQCYVDDQLKGSMFQENDYWRYDLDTSGTTKGSHEIEIKAADDSPLHNEGAAARSVYCHPNISMSKISFLNGHILWRRDTDERIIPPQWDPEYTNPFAYTIGSEMTVEVEMTSQDVTESVYIRYEVGGTWLNSEETEKGTYSKEKETYDAFPCSLAHYPDALPWVMDYRLDQSYHFFIRKSPDSDWCPAGTANATHPQVYLTFGTPISPWGQTLDTPPKTRTCWSRVIHDACIWMPEEGYSSALSLDAKKRLAYKAFHSSGKDYKGWDSHCNGDGTYFEMWQFIEIDSWADCRDMSSWWAKLCNSIGLNGQVRRINGPFVTKAIDPIGTPIPYPGEPPWPENGWGTTSWNFHQVGNYTNVFDPCLQLNQSAPRVAQYENIDSPYKTDLYDSGTWLPQTPFSLQEVN